MIQPAPTSRIAPDRTRGVLQAVTAPTASRPGFITLAISNTSYQLHLIPAGEISTPAGKRIVGRIHAQARRVDKVSTGGRYVEPVFGRPRRVQGAVLSTDVGARTITVDAGVAIACTLTDPRQNPADFEPGDLVSFDALDGATFTPD